MASAQLFEAVPFYAGLTLEEIGGRGVRWQEREAAAALPGAASRARGRAARSRSGLRAGPPELAGYRSLWDAPEVEFSPGARVPVPARESATPSRRAPSRRRRPCRRRRRDGGA